tara:strand:- start:973 stop:2301 length:1329 start_codon:yes stop_codon:yes gene_type:complete
MALIPLGFWAASGGAAGGPYWIATLGGSGADYSSAVAVDSLDNNYVLGYTISAGAGNYDFLIIKRNTEGVVQWQRTLGGTGNDRGYGLAIDSSDNLYVCGYSTISGEFDERFLVAKYNSSGTIQWQRLFGNGFAYGEAAAVDTSGNVYFAGYGYGEGAGDQEFYIVKYNSSGTLQWQRTLGGASADKAYAIHLDSSNNVYVSGDSRSTGAGGQDILLAKYSSSGVIQWQRSLGGASNDESHSIATDSSGNVYIAGYSYSVVADSVLLLAKYNPSGTLQWQRALYNSYGTSTAQAVAVDSNNDVYITGEEFISGSVRRQMIVAKYNSSGTIQWQRMLGASSDEFSYSIAVDSLDDIYITGKTPNIGVGGQEVITAKLANDGSLLGTYVLDGVNITYAVSTLTTTTPTLTAATSSLTSSTSSRTTAASSRTDAVSSLTSYLVDL